LAKKDSTPSSPVLVLVLVLVLVADADPPIYSSV
jgi:hypothetical protein